MMDFSEAINSLVTSVVSCLPATSWEAVLLDFELREMQDSFDSDYVGIVLVRTEPETLTQEQFYLDQDTRQAAMALYRQRSRDAKEANAGFVLRIQQSGGFTIDFKEKVKRLDGIWDQADEQYIDNYRDHYLRENSET